MRVSTLGALVVASLLFPTASAQVFFMLPQVWQPVLAEAAERAETAGEAFAALVESAPQFGRPRVYSIELEVEQNEEGAFEVRCKKVEYGYDLEPTGAELPCVTVGVDPLDCSIVEIVLFFKEGNSCDRESPLNPLPEIVGPGPTDHVYTPSQSRPATPSPSSFTSRQSSESRPLLVVDPDTGKLDLLPDPEARRLVVTRAFLSVRVEVRAASGEATFAGSLSLFASPRDVQLSGQGITYEVPPTTVAAPLVAVAFPDPLSTDPPIEARGAEAPPVPAEAFELAARLAMLLEAADAARAASSAESAPPVLALGSPPEIPRADPTGPASVGSQVTHENEGKFETTTETSLAAAGLEVVQARLEVVSATARFVVGDDDLVALLAVPEGEAHAEPVGVVGGTSRAAPHSAAPNAALASASPADKTERDGMSASRVAAAPTKVASLLLALAFIALLGAVASLYSRIARRDVLANRVREKMCVLLDASPGSGASTLAREAEVALNTALYHLRILSREGVVSSREIAGETAYFLAGDPRAADVTLRRRQAAPTARLLETVAARPGMTLQEAAAAVRLNYKTAHRHVKRLRAAGAIRIERDNSHMRLFAGGIDLTE